MKQLFLDKSISFINNYYNYTDLNKQKLLYGLEGLYLTITKFIFIILLSLLLGIFKETILVIVLFNIIRYTGFGFHAEKSYHCLILSTINFSVIPYIMSKFTLSEEVILIISSICIISYLLFAPADTAKRPLPNKKKRVIRKIATVLIGIIYTFLIFLVKNDTFTCVIISSLIIQFIVINPLTYKIFKQPYNNYKKLN